MSQLEENSPAVTSSDEEEDEEAKVLLSLINK